MSTRLSLCLMLALVGPAVAQAPSAPYAGQQTRVVSSLSAEEIDGFLRGAGMGLAKPAELNGFPGPMHVLELADTLGLTADQRQRVRSAMDAMKAEGRTLGAAYVAAEAAVDAAFRAGASRDAIAGKVSEAGRLLSAIRMSHLDAHLAITPLLTADQRGRYAVLRGYTSTTQGPAGSHVGQHKH